MVNKSSNLKTIGVVLMVVIIATLATSTGYFYIEYQKIKKNPDILAKEEKKTLIERINKYMELPKNEEPSIATVSDIKKLKGQLFFSKAENGDKILIYAKAAKAILFRPSTGRVMEFAPLVVGQDNPTQALNGETVNVAIYNGTKTSGITQEYEKKLSALENVTVTNKENAAKNDYEETVIVVFKSQCKQIADQIATLIDGKVISGIPDGETKPQADMLIIVGSK
jgi:hypothetical protein